VKFYYLFTALISVIPSSKTKNKRKAYPSKIEGKVVDLI
jgi:hypothetical protein